METPALIPRPERTLTVLARQSRRQIIALGQTRRQAAARAATADALVKLASPRLRRLRGVVLANQVLFEFGKHDVENAIGGSCPVGLRRRGAGQCNHHRQTCQQRPHRSVSLVGLLARADCEYWPLSKRII